MKNFIKSLQFRLSDLFALLGLIPFAFFLGFGQEFMQKPDPLVVGFPMWAIIVCLILMLVFWGYYLYLELFKKGDKFQRYVGFALLFICLINIVAILVQPKTVVEYVFIRYSEDAPETVGQIFKMSVDVSDMHRLIFIGEIIGTCLCIYIGIFVFPKRFKSLAFLKYLGYALFIFLFILII